MDYKKEKNTLFQSIFNSMLKNGTVELLFQGAYCPQEKPKERGLKSRVGNFDLFLGYLEREGVNPEIIINFGDEEPKKEWLDKIKSTERDENT